MARIRTVKPEFWRHPVMGRVSDKAKIVAVALLNFADDEGFFLADPAIVKADTVPYDDSVSIHGVLSELSSAGWIEVRQHCEQGPIGLVVNFTEHQKINRPTPSKLKEYWEDTQLMEDSRRTHGGLTTGKERKGKEQGKGKDLDSGTSTLVSSDHVSTQEDLLTSLSSTDLTSEKKTRRSKAVKAAREAKGARTWAAYSTAYAKRYGRAPMRNGQTSAICVQLVDALGTDLAPLVAAYYLTTNAQPYVGSSHALTLLKRDYQKFATEYETGNRTTQAQARALDRLQGEGDGWNRVIDRRGE